MSNRHPQGISLLLETQYLLLSSFFTFHPSSPFQQKAKEIEEESEAPLNKQPSSGLCSSLPLTAALLSASCKVLPSKMYGPEHLLRLFGKTKI